MSKALPITAIVSRLRKPYLAGGYQLRAMDAFNRFIPWALALHWAANEGKRISHIQEAKDYLGSPEALEKPVMHYVRMLDWALKVRMDRAEVIQRIEPWHKGFQWVGGL